MKHSYSFEKLDAWKQAKNLAVLMYKKTTEFPDSEKYGMTNQIRRSAISIPANIAEGSARTSKKAQRNFYQIAYSSLMELYNHLIISDELNYFNLSPDIKEDVYMLSRTLNGLYNSTSK